VIWPLKIVAFGIDYFGFLSNLFVDDHCWYQLRDQWSW
jgi:hypothetical protein